MPSVWDSVDSKAFIQRGGPGNRWEYLEKETDVDAIAGGDQSVESDYARSQYIGRRKTSNPGDFTGTVTARRYNVRSVLRDLAKNQCYFSLLLLSGCPELDITQYNGGIDLIDAFFTTRYNSSAKMIDSMEGANAKVLDSLPFSAPVLHEWRRLSHDRITNSVNADINDVIALGNKRCAGPCGTENDGSQEYVAVGGAVAPATIPRVYYTNDGGVSWKSCTLTGITNAEAVRVTKDGDRILIACTGTSAGLWAISYNTLKDPATTTSIAATLVSGITSGTVVNDVLAVGNRIFAVGNTGTIWHSTDRGYSFSILNSTATANNLTRIGAQDENTVYFGGASGTLLKFANLTALTVISPSAITGDDVTAMAVPYRFTDEVYVGTSTGEVWRSRDGGTSWSQVRFTGDNIGTISALEFWGELGALLFIVQNNASPAGRVMVDRSGGAGGADVQFLGGFTSPANSGLNAIAPSDANFALVVGDINTGAGYMGRVHG